MKRFGIEYDKNTRAWLVTDKEARDGYVESDTKDAVKALADLLNERADLVAYKRYIEANLERIERGGWTPVCFDEFITSEERETHGSAA